MRGRILLIEDDPASRELVRYLMECAGHAVLTADNGGTGLRLALEQRPDLIVCDIQMPILNGYEVARRLRERPDWVPVPLIAVTASSMAGDREIALKAGFTEHIAKPIVPETLVAQLEAFLPRSPTTARGE